MSNAEFDTQKLIFSDEYITANYPEHIPTGFKQLDTLLGGGISPGLIVLGAISSLGKSTLALQIAQNISSQGRPVVYYSLEMPKHAIAMKALQRSAFKHLKGRTPFSDEMYTKLKNKALSINDLLHSKNLNESKRKLKEYAQKECEQECSELIVVERSNKEFSAADIHTRIKGYIQECRKNGKQTPVVFVDYLQILISQTDKHNKTDKQIVDDNIKELWLLANQCGIPVVVISSVNRESYNKNIAFSSFKESGGIEFTADIVLGMQFSALHGKTTDTKAFNADEEKGKDPRRVELIVLKQRYGKSGSNAYDRFIYYPAYSYFEEGDFKEDTPEEVTDPKATNTRKGREKG